MRTLKLILAYDGTNYVGWQRQTDRPTIQALLEAALADIEGRSVTVYGAGRTDAGVHALGQVASVRLTHPIDTPALVRALNAKLPSDIRVLHVEQVAEGFHARFDARSKTYRYRLVTGRVESPFEPRYVWHLPHPVDVPAMRAAGDVLRGRHDFAAFQTAAREGAPASTVRTISELTIGTERAPAWLTPTAFDRGDVIVFKVVGDGFLRHMVRVVVGTLVDVGSGRRSVEDVAAALDSRRRESAGPTAPACGLFLVRVDYP